MAIVVNETGGQRLPGQAGTAGGNPATPTSDTAPRYSPADFAFVTIKEPDHIKTAASLLMHAQGKPGEASGTALGMQGITTTKADRSSYSVITYARGGVYGNHANAVQSQAEGAMHLPHGLYVFSSSVPFDRVRDIGPPESEEYPNGLGGLTAESSYYVLRMIPAPPQGPQSNLAGETQHTGSIILPRPYGSGRASPSNTLTISEWRIDNNFSAGVGIPKGGTWLEAYIAAWETLATPHPLLGRKPQLSLKFGNRWWGIGQTALYLDSVDVNRDYYEGGVLASAVLNLRFSEVIV